MATWVQVRNRAWNMDQVWEIGFTTDKQGRQEVRLVFGDGALSILMGDDADAFTNWFSNRAAVYVAL